MRDATTQAPPRRSGAEHSQRGHQPTTPIRVAHRAPSSWNSEAKGFGLSGLRGGKLTTNERNRPQIPCTQNRLICAWPPSSLSSHQAAQNRR
jgi:hypothetical protein